MKLTNSNLIYKIFLFASFITVISCNKDWDNHYKNKQTGIANMNIVEYVHSQADLSIFDTMLQISGYDTLLNKPQNFTVWAPANSALQGIDLSNRNLVIDIVKNHCTQFMLSTSDILTGWKYIRVFSGKYILFSNDNEGFRFGNQLLTATDIVTNNGIVHISTGYLPFQPNIYEFIKRTPGFSSLYNYIYSNWDSVMDNSSGYDSLFIYSNKVFNRIGQLNRETVVDDSAYTVILPTDTAWKLAYAKIKDYYVSAHKDMALQIQDYYTKRAIVADLVFRNRVFDPYSVDSLVSTTKSIFKAPGYLFKNTQMHNLSNGLAYVTDTLYYKAKGSWAKTLIVQAENSTGRTSGNANLLNRYYFGNEYYISGYRYIMVEPTTSSSFSTIYAEFSIPNNLSARYNIYCVFVPSKIENPIDTLPFRAKFSIIYLGANKVMQTITPTVPKNITNPKDTTKMLIAAKFKFPYSHVSPDEKATEIARIRVINDVKTTEKAFSRNMKIDCILLEPVDE